METTFNQNANVDNGALIPSANIPFNPTPANNVNGDKFPIASSNPNISLPNNLNTVDASRVNGSVITTPTLPMATSSAGSLEAINSITAQNKADSISKAKDDAELLKLKNDQATTKTGIQGIFDRLTGRSSERDQLYKDTGVDTSKMAVDELTSQIEAEQLSSRRKIEDIMKNNPTGALRGGQQDLVNNIQRESLSKVADLSIIQNAALRRYSTAKDIADRQIDAETENDRLKLEALKFFYEDNKSTLDKKDQRAYEEKIKAEDRKYNEAVASKKALADTKLEALKNANEQNAPVSVMQAIQSSTTPEQVIISAGAYGGDALRKVQIAKGYADITEINAKALKEGNLKNFKTPSIVNPLTGKLDPTGQLASVINSTGIKDNTNLQNILGVVTATQGLAENNTEGNFPGIRFGSLSRGMFADQKAQSNISDIEAINLKVQQWASGAALTEAQTKQVAKITPKLGDTDKQIKNKINALADFMQGQARSIIASQGINYQPEKIDYFKPIVKAPDGTVIQITD